MTMIHGKLALGVKAAVLCGICYGGVELGVGAEIAASLPPVIRSIPSLQQDRTAEVGEGGPSKVVTSGAAVAGVAAVARSEVVKQPKPELGSVQNAVGPSVASTREIAEGLSRDGLKLAMESGREQREQLRLRINASLEQVALEQRRMRLDAFQRVEILRSSLRDHLEVLQVPLPEIRENGRGRRGDD
jgi:hypothetical protein